MTISPSPRITAVLAKIKDGINQTLGLDKIPRWWVATARPTALVVMHQHMGLHARRQRLLQQPPHATRPVLVPGLPRAPIHFPRRENTVVRGTYALAVVWSTSWRHSLLQAPRAGSRRYQTARRQHQTGEGQNSNAHNAACRHERSHERTGRAPRRHTVLVASLH